MAGIANDNAWTIAEKREARLGIDLPEFVDADLRQQLGVTDEVSKMWRAGLVDLEAPNGKVLTKMTLGQSATWKLARR